MSQEYFRPHTVQEAVSLLLAAPGKGRVIGGGTDLLIAEANPSRKSARLVDLGDIPGMKDIRVDNGFLVIGGCVTHTEAAVSPLVRQYAAAVAEACAKVGSTQIRNMGTLAGNVVNALPAADSAVTLSALGATCVVAGADGMREIPMADMYKGVGRSAVNSREQCLVQFRVPLPGAGMASAYARMEQRKALSLPMLCVAVHLHVDAGLVKNVAIVMAPAGPGPVRAQKAEAFLLGKKAEPSVFAEAGLLAKQDADFRSSAVRGSKEYREGVLPVFVRRALAKALERATR